MSIQKINSYNNVYLKAGFKIPTFKYSSATNSGKDKTNFKKNTTKIALSIVGVSSLIILGAIAFRSKKKIEPLPKIEKNIPKPVENIQENGSKIHQEMKTMATKVTNLFNQKPSKNNVLEEFEDGILIRKSTFSRGIVSSIEEFKEKSSDLYEFDFNGNPIRCLLGIEKLEDKTKIAKEYTFYYNSDCVEQYCEGIIEDINGTRKILKRIFFNGLKLDEIQENIVE